MMKWFVPLILLLLLLFSMIVPHSYAPAQTVPQQPQEPPTSKRIDPRKVNPPLTQTPARPKSSWRKLVGFDAAYQRLRLDLPLGRGVEVGYVEGPMDGGYMPNAHDKRLAGLTLIPHSGIAPPSIHATHGAAVAFGPQGIAPGVKALQCFRADQFIGDGYLNTGRPVPPTDDGVRLFNHSWIGDASPFAIHVLRRVDWQIDQRDVIMCVGVNNGRESTVPALLASAYNVIAVGTAAGGGNSSGGYTQIEVHGRCKPDIVGPRDLTSFATPSVTACCAMLLEQAHKMNDERAYRSETIKAVLLAGAVKGKRWAPAEGKPLDEHLGAGVVNVDRALQAMAAGSPKSLTIHRAFGWDFVQLSPTQSRGYHFEIGQTWREASFVLVWNRRIDGRTAKLFGSDEDVWLDVPRVANFDLYLDRYEDDGSLCELAHSSSQVDNVELIHCRKLEPGRYRLRIERRDDGHDEPWDVALAWWMAPPSVVEATRESAPAAADPL